MIFVECDADITLVKFILNIPEIELMHAGGKSMICKNLERLLNCKGMVDEDPESIQPSYIQSLHLEKDLPQHDLQMLLDNPNQNILVVLRPRLEEWILKSAIEADVDVRNFNLPDDANLLHRKINANLDNFKDLLKELSNKNSERLKSLKNLLEG